MGTRTSGSVNCNIAFKVISVEPRAVEATARTIESIVPGSHYVERDRGGRAVVDQDEIYALSTDPNYLKFATVQQGYVLDARILK